MFKIRIKLGENELEIESADKQFVQDQVEKFQTQHAGRATHPAGEKKRKTGGQTSARKPKAGAKGQASKADTARLRPILDAINEHSDYDRLKQQAIATKSAGARILLLLGFTKQHDADPNLNADEIEWLSDELHNKIRAGNVKSGIKTIKDKVSEKTDGGAWKLNTRGDSEFDKLITP